MIGFSIKVSTAIALGINNIARVLVYRIGTKLGLSSVRKLKGETPIAPFFLQSTLEPLAIPSVTSWDTSAFLFSRWLVPFNGEIPNWHSNLLTGQQVAQPDRHWWQIPDFDPNVGDIKVIWELSRMDWVIAFAQHARNGNGAALERLNSWLTDWCQQNPPFRGVNWKCGQEASFRVMHLAMASIILGQVKTAPPGLIDLIILHLRRIESTLKYAISQDNNHGTSEACAVFIGGSWLEYLGHASGARWQKIGRYWLENRASRLIGLQGSFSQYSLNYHRLMLDTFSMAEVWRRHLLLPAFSSVWQSRALQASQWLRCIINVIDGNGPNIGANDGARLLQLTDSPYRDYRPSVQLTIGLFANQRAYVQVGMWDYAFSWLNIPIPQQLACEPESYIADDGGFAMLRRSQAMAILRYPRFKFRPSHADALHLDLWVGSANLLKDDGSYSYNTEQQWMTYFGSTASHNTVQFDDRDQMPKISRFLFGSWLKTSHLEPLSDDGEYLRFSAGYIDNQGINHQRTVMLSNTLLHVEDSISGFYNKAVLRWRLSPWQWKLKHEGNSVYIENNCNIIRLFVTVDCLIVRCEIVSGWESLYYMEKTKITVLEIEVLKPCLIITEIEW